MRYSRFVTVVAELREVPKQAYELLAIDGPSAGGAMFAGSLNTGTTGSRAERQEHMGQHRGEPPTRSTRAGASRALVVLMRRDSNRLPSQAHPR